MADENIIFRPLDARINKAFQVAYEDYGQSSHSGNEKISFDRSSGKMIIRKFGIDYELAVISYIRKLFSVFHIILCISHGMLKYIVKIYRTQFSNEEKWKAFMEE